MDYTKTKLTLNFMNTQFINYDTNRKSKRGFFEVGKKKMQYQNT